MGGKSTPSESSHTERHTNHVRAKDRKSKPRGERHKPRTCQPMVNTLQVDGLARIPGYDKDYTCRILSHRIAPPRAVFDVLVLDRGRGKTMNDLVDRNCELPANKATLNNAKLHTDTHMHKPRACQRQRYKPRTFVCLFVCLLV